MTLALACSGCGPAGETPRLRGAVNSRPSPPRPRVHDSFSPFCGTAGGCFRQSRIPNHTSKPPAKQPRETAIQPQANACGPATRKLAAIPRPRTTVASDATLIIAWAPLGTCSLSLLNNNAASPAFRSRMCMYDSQSSLLSRRDMTREEEC
jgi:hypothetical protein